MGPIPKSWVGPKKRGREGGGFGFKCGNGFALCRSWELLALLLAVGFCCGRNDLMLADVPGFFGGIFIFNL